ncbi:DUF4837 family protein [Mangrovibacterium diazotrophicum]|uniref:Uncharacterized protein DUF4837 n=1 Tax=Mangrovibacterium diazotrophicum TaxID=1261403 RepID=A0A419WAX0_9BACT|nr:DUF4837 family protein [Mangrovibacterium diazotrophicum]RKD92593.1 uncharacterized protein DUF4837 [Mangrovibacterium diazotrophicum]
MKRISLIFFVFVSLSLILSSCKDDTKLRKKVTGKAGEVVVVIPKETWDGNVGETIRQTLAQPQISLPQAEPLFDLISVPPAAFKEIFKTSRNIVNVRISPSIDSAKVEFKKDIWAWPQAVVNISAKSSEDFDQVFNANSSRIVAYLLKAERDRLMGNYAKYSEKSVEPALKKLNVDLTVPVGFKVAKEGTDFMWMRYDTPEIMQGVAVYSFPYTSDSTFTESYLLAKRDSVLEKYIEGPSSGSYMVTEHRLPVTMNVFSYKNNYAAEIRGLWRVEHDFMGGPFVSLAVLDASNNRIVVADGFVYAPRFDKRNYLRQVEAMLYSLKFPDQAKNDKINSQINMGN